ncbi:hypothetical protein KQH49_14645 [Mycetohabitans sp. B5]|uniref:Glycerophosphoryl diester phosphodiesterase family protein n=1 Tax=Mycetohabitans endofungorum TaxID=417203 RepID=A0A2P5K7M0_9BURK|nr:MULTISPECIES: glycerophosphodiester phosphodiesterase family protein [Mycetohabitans]MCG1056090.1 hypothetical protein [Mycetohabitans sp. B5]PPB82066.1 glycerophosphoryl diester phosphodiesterase family protein [Mycetohabitans endofungorum]
MKEFKTRPFRKINRSLQLLDRANIENIDDIVATVVFGLNNKFDPDWKEETVPEGLSSSVIEIVEKAITQAQKNKNTTAREANAYYGLSPLVSSLKGAEEGQDKGTYVSIVDEVQRALRLKMAQRSDGVSIIAHRGHGPTNRTRGGLIKLTDKRRTDRPAENSESAFRAAFNAAGTKLQPGLDGIECDVFLSKDNIPILSHEGKIKEQLSDSASYPHIDEEKSIDHLNAEELYKIRRNGEESNFISLEHLLKLSEQKAPSYFNGTNNPFRIEIEMKGKPSDEKNKDEYSKNLTSSVAKTINRFLKRQTEPWCWEFILFNGEMKDIESYNNLRFTKTHLGGLYTGINYKKHTFDKIRPDELRMALSNQNIKNFNNSKLGEYEYIITLVPGAERPYEEYESELGELDFPNPKSEYAQSVNKDMLNKKGKEYINIIKFLDSIKDRTKTDQSGPSHHLLTDIPKNAEHYKLYIQGKIPSMSQLTSLNSGNKQPASGTKRKGKK